MTENGRFAKLDFDEAGQRPLAAQGDAWPNQDDAHCLESGDKRFRVGLYDAALAAYSRALRFNRDIAAAWVGQVRCLIHLGEYVEAVTWSDRGLERFPGSAELLASKGLAMVMAGNPSEGMEYLDGAVELRSPSAWVWLARGQALLLRRETQDNGHRCLMKAMEVAPVDIDIQMRVGIAYNNSRLFNRARPLLASMTRQDPKNPLAAYHLGIAQEGTGDVRSAAGSFQHALDLDPRFRQAEFALDRVKNSNPFARVWRKFSVKNKV